LVKILKICFINVINIITVLLSDKIILSSSKSFNTYKLKYDKYNNNFTTFPLLFDDEALNLIGTKRKKYISYIGTIAADHAFDSYVNFIKVSIEQNWFTNFDFLIACKNNIPIKEKRILSSLLQSGRITISEGYPMTNNEINNYFNESLIVWNAYNRSMQSGVLPKSYMFGAAILGSNSCNNEFINNHVTGILLKNNKDVYEIKDALVEIIESQNFFSTNCRKMFIENFYYKAFSNRFLSFLNQHTY
jgi:glycosyltransferase involved in cell wall biosynthesis